jgi:toxin CptA
MGALGPRNKYSGAGFGDESRVAIAIGPSPFAERAIGLAALATLAVVAVAPVAAALKLMLAAWVGLAAHRSMRRAGQRDKRAAVACVRTDPTRAIEVRFADGRFAHGTVVDGSFVAPWLTVIHWRPARSRWRRTILVLPDMVEERDFRRLRVVLRWSAAV